MAKINIEPLALKQNKTSEIKICGLTEGIIGDGLTIEQTQHLISVIQAHVSFFVCICISIPSVSNLNFQTDRGWMPHIDQCNYPACHIKHKSSHSWQCWHYPQVSYGPDKIWICCHFIQRCHWLLDCQRATWIYGLVYWYDCNIVYVLIHQYWCVTQDIYLTDLNEHLPTWMWSNASHLISLRLRQAK